ncbi:MAG: alanine racemase [Gammaproteobacteria bacterium]|jgi:alanine racemase|nr:alanine racemase [Gammaproteobacteria bacterium]MDP6166023.1 alanine racemase [Gammaproteobacteria bacterium]
MTRPSHIQVNLQALRNNYQWACELAPQSKTMAIIKADAYGHGAVACARALDDLAPAYGVACIEEALQLRQAGINKPILLLEGIFTDDEIATAAEQDLWMMVEDPWQVDAIVNAKLQQPVQVWTKMDTGMHRLGLAPFRLPELLAKLQASPNVCNGIVMASHFACADELNNDFTRQQIALFHSHLPSPDMPFSLANSAAIMAWPESHGHWNRAGFMLYGNTPLDAEHDSNLGLTPVMSLNSSVISLRQVAVGEAVGYGQLWKAQRPSIIATVAMGYADGYPRHASTGTPVLINGQRAPIIGRVSMDMITIDVTDLSGVCLGSPVCFWGHDLNANEVASHIGTIGYELITRMGQRLPKIYV